MMMKSKSIIQSHLNNQSINNILRIKFINVTSLNLLKQWENISILSQDQKKFQLIHVQILKDTWFSLKNPQKKLYILTLIMSVVTLKQRLKQILIIIIYWWKLIQILVEIATGLTLKSEILELVKNTNLLF